MKTSLVIDAGVLSLHFAGDQRVGRYFNAVDDGEAMGLVAEANLAEYYYQTCRKLGRESADTRYLLVRASKLAAVHDRDLTRLAGLERCRQQLDLSLADCFALALAKRERALLLTTDSELRGARDVQVRFFKV